MKNNLFNGNLFKISLSLISITLLFVQACKNDKTELRNIDPIASAKAWYLKSNINGSMQLQLQSSKGTIQQIKQEIDWVSAKAFKLDDGTDVFGIPVKMILGEAVLGGSFMMLISKDKIGYNLQIAYNTRTDYFKGSISNKEMINIYKQTLVPDKINLRVNGSRAKLMAITCTNWHMVTNFYDGAGNFITSTSRFLYQSCSGDIGDYPEPDHGGPVDCAGTLAGGAYLSDCGCIGGATGILECYKVIMKVDVDPNVRQCLKDIKAALEALGMKNTSKSTGLIAGVLNKLNLSTGLDFNATITEGSINSKYIAETTWETNPNGNRITQIKFNETYLNRATDLKMAGTMMHEYIHAYFDWNLYLMKSGATTYDANFEKTYKLLFDESGVPLNDGFGANQHQQIATSFVKEIAAMLKIYAANQNIPLPADPLYFEKIGWGGLQYTSLYKYAPEGTTYANSAEAGNNSTTITQTIKCKKL